MGVNSAAHSASSQAEPTERRTAGLKVGQWAGSSGNCSAASMVERWAGTTAGQWVYSTAGRTAVLKVVWTALNLAGLSAEMLAARRAEHLAAWRAECWAVSLVGPKVCWTAGSWVDTTAARMEG